MRSKVVPVKNIVRLLKGADELMNHNSDTPSIGIVQGKTGYGKTTATTWLVNRVNGIYVRALKSWTPREMLVTLLDELERDAHGSNSRMVRDIVHALMRNRRPIFIDEADYIAGRDTMVEILRDIHDLAQIPIVLIGETGIERKLAHLERFTRRITQNIQFEPCDAADIRVIAKDLCEVTINDDLLDLVLRRTHGAIGLIKTSLGAIESEARTRGKQSMSIDDWGNRALFTGNAPTPVGEH